MDSLRWTLSDGLSPMDPLWRTLSDEPSPIKYICNKLGVYDLYALACKGVLRIIGYSLVYLFPFLYIIFLPFCILFYFVFVPFFSICIGVSILCNTHSLTHSIKEKYFFLLSFHTYKQTFYYHEISK